MIRYVGEKSREFGAVATLFAAGSLLGSCSDEQTVTDETPSVYSSIEDGPGSVELYEPLTSRKLSKDKFEAFMRNEESVLSDGTKLPRVYQIQRFDRGKIFMLESEYGPKYCTWIFDEGDGRPYMMTSTGSYVSTGGKKVDDTRRWKKRFDFTYKYDGQYYFVWNPTGFRHSKTTSPAVRKYLKKHNIPHKIKERKLQKRSARKK